jgi:type IV pilus assembly protein PilM
MSAASAAPAQEAAVPAPAVAPAPPAPPAQAAQAAPEPPAEKVPLLKREISFKRKPKPAAAAPAAKPEKVPLLKREISFKRKPKPAPAPPPVVPPVAEVPVPAPEPVVAAAPEPKVPLLKREISFKRKPKPAAAAPAAKPEKVPLLKREISFKRKPKPAAAAVSPPVAAPAAPAPSPAPAAPEPKVPLLKREISFGRKAGTAAAPRAARGSRARTLVGVKVGASGISAAHVSNNGQIDLLQLVREPLPRGVVVGGELREVETLAAALREIFRKYRLPRRAVRLGVSNNRIGVRIIEISGVMDPKQLQNAIRFRAQEVLPITLEDAVLDFQQLSESVNAEGELVRRILLVVAYRDLIDRYVLAFKQAGVRLVGIDLEAFGLLRALAPPAPNGQRAEAAHVVVSIGHERSTFAVSDGSVCEFTRVLDWGGATLDVAIARQLNLTPSEAEPVKHSIALDGSQRPLPPGFNEEQMALAADLVRRQLQTFARELVSSLQFYQNQPGSLGIGDIVISGGTSQLPGLASELQRLIGVSVRVGDPFTRVRVSKRLGNARELQSLAVAIGLGIED